MTPSHRGPRLPPIITEESSVIASHIPLPPQPSIAYARFIPLQQQQESPYKAIEFARQRIVDSVWRNGTTIQESLLPIVHIGKEEVALWIFSIRSEANGPENDICGKGKQKEHASDAEELESLGFDGLKRCNLSQFTPSSLYPCSSDCAKHINPCSSCAQISPNLSTTSEETMTFPSTTPLFLRLPLRQIHMLFIDAVRERVINDICTTPYRSGESKRRVTTSYGGLSSFAARLGNGFLSDRDHMFPMWGCGWERPSHRRPLIHTAIDIYLSPTAIHIRPLPVLTSLLPIPIVSSSPSSRSTSSRPPSDTVLASLPLSPGIPLILAPYPTPAFYVSTPAGTSIPHSLRAQFSDALKGLGASIFPYQPGFSFSSVKPYSSSLKPPISNVSASYNPLEPFIIVFIPLLNPQGEPKGVTALWPARLAFIDTSPNRVHLTKLPEMPGTEVLLTPPRGSGTQSSAQTSGLIPTSPIVRRCASIRSSGDYLRESQRTFRNLELSSNRRIPGVLLSGAAKNTASYVDSVAKERERERERANQERMRREREAKESKPSSGALPPTTSSATQNTQPHSDPAGPIPASPKFVADPARLTSSWRPTPTAFFAKAAQDNVVHSFYPSPPDWNPVASTQNSGPTEQSANVAAISTSSYKTSSPPHPTSQPQPGSNITHQTIRNTLDLSNGMDLGMDIDVDDMSMGISLGDTVGMLGVNMGVNMDAGGLLDGGFGSFADPFTDDDFNYFDAPPPEPIPVIVPDNPTPLHPLDGDQDGWLANGLEGANQRGGALVSSQLQPDSSASIGIHVSTQDALLSQPLVNLQMSEDDREFLPPAPDLIPSSPAKTPWSMGSPPTPSLELTMPPSFPVGKRMFEPIRFGTRHHVADGKYRDVTGKFAFPNTLPRTNPPLDFVLRSPDVSDPDREDGWKLRYDAVTDPRVGVINHLRGVKRKRQAGGHAYKTVDGRLRDEEWKTLFGQPEDAEVQEQSSTSEEEEEDIEDLVPELDQDDDSDSQSPSRPSTPPPSGLPLAATLLYFRLHHSHLLPLGIPMRPSYGDLTSHDDPHPAPLSVPTPVSPAATLGSTSERNKTVELLAQAIAKEAVENYVWAQAWGSSLDRQPNPSQMRHEISQTELTHIANLMGKVTGLKGPSSLSALLEHSSSSIPTSEQHTPPCGNLQMLQQPRFSVGRAGLIHYMLPSAIRFWEKEGLGPRSGTKDVVAFALFEEGDERALLVQSWLERVGRAYSARGFGTHVVGSAGPFEHGLVPLQFETVRKTLPNLISALPQEPQHIVIYIIAPPSVYSSLKSSALRAIIVNQNRVSKLSGQHDFDHDRILIHFVPDYYVADPYTYPTSRHVNLEWFTNSVYDRLLRATLRQISRQFGEYNSSFENRFQVPAFVLARNAPPRTQLEWDEHPSLNVLDRHTFLHVGYCMSKCKKWLLAACIDERGEAHDVAVWGVPCHESQAASVNWVVSNVWIFVKQFMQHADTEWRIVVSKLGEIGEIEVEVWMSHLETAVSAHAGPPVHVNLVCAQNDLPLPFLRPADVINEPQPTITSKAGTVFVDVSSVTYSTVLSQRTPIVSPSLLCPCEHPCLVAPVAALAEEVDLPNTTRHPSPILPLCTTVLLHVPNDTDYFYVDALHIHLLYAYKSPRSTLTKSMHEVHAEITRNWYELTVLTHERWHFPQQGRLPFHLAALELMSNVLDPEILALDVHLKGNEYLGS